MRTNHQNRFLKGNLKALRDYCELTQQQITDVLHIDRSTYTYWECGKVSPSIHRVTELVAFYQSKGIRLDFNLLLGNSLTASVLENITEPNRKKSM